MKNIGRTALNKVVVTLKSVEAANAKLQLARTAAGDRLAPPNIKTPPPSPSAIAQAGQRALQSFKR